MEGVRSISPAAEKWRVVYLLSKAPWVQEHSIHCWAVVDHGDDGKWQTVEPLIFGANGYGLELPDENKDYRISRPEDPADRWVEEARTIIRERRKAARRAKIAAKKREEEREARRLAALNEPPKPRKPRRPPGLKRLWDRASWGLRYHLVKNEGIDVLCEFLDRGCKIGKDEEGVGVDDLLERYTQWCREYRVEPLPKLAVTTSLKEVGAVGEKKGNKYVRWKGLSFTDARPNLPQEEQDPEEAQRALAEFVRKQVERSNWGSTGSQEAYGCYRAWCRRKNLRPLPRGPLESALKRVPGATQEKDSDGTKQWKGISCKWPGPP